MKQKVLVFYAFDWCFLCVMLIIISGLLFIPFFDRNNQAILYMSIKQYEKAEKKWLQILSKDSFSSFYRMNLALNYILFNKSDEAIQEYEITRNLLKAGAVSGSFKTHKQSEVNSDISTSEDEIVEPEVVREDTEQNYKNKILFYSFFNSAAASVQEGEVESALGFYQQALGPYPDSLEVKTNIELLAMNSQAPSEKNKDKKDKDKKDDASKGSSEKKEEDKKEEKSSEENKEKKGKDEKDQQDNKGEKDSDQEKEQKKQQSDQENNESDTTGEDSQNSPESQSAKQGNSDRTQNVNERQKEAILKAILEQEKKIRERRSRKSGKTSPVEKDW